MRWWLCVAALAFSSQALFGQDATYQGKTVKEWTEALKRQDPAKRYQALAALYEAGAEAGPAAPEVVKLLKDSVVGIRRAAVHVLSVIDQDGIPAALGQALRDSDAGVRQIAASALVDRGEPAQMVLADALADKDVNVKLLALSALDSMDATGKDTLTAIGRLLKEANLTVRKRALFVLARRAAEDADARPFVVQALRDKDQAVRAAAAQALASGGVEIVEELAKAAKEGDAGTRVLALQALGTIGEALDMTGLAVLLRGIDDADAKVRQAAVAGIAQLKGKARELAGDDIFKEVAKLLADKDVGVRRTAVFAMGSIGVMGADDVAKIADGLKDRDLFVRGFTVQALGNCCAEGAADDVVRAALTQVASALRDADGKVQNLAAQLLTREEARSVPVLIPIVEKGQGKHRQWAAAILGAIGAAAADAVPALEKMAKDSMPAVRQAALAALQKIRD